MWNTKLDTRKKTFQVPTGDKNINFFQEYTIFFIYKKKPRNCYVVTEFNKMHVLLVFYY